MQVAPNALHNNFIGVNNKPPYRNHAASSTKKLCENKLYTTGANNAIIFPELRTPDAQLSNSNSVQNPTQSSISINANAIVNSLADDDRDFISVLPHTVFGIRRVSSNGNNHDRVVLDPTGTIFTFTPAPGFFGGAGLGFYLWDGKEIGAMEIITIDVTLHPSVVINDLEDVLINGDFEDGTEVRTFENPDIYYSPAFNISDGNLHFGAINSGAHPFSHIQSNFWGGFRVKNSHNSSSV